MAKNQKPPISDFFDLHYRMTCRFAAGKNEFEFLENFEFFEFYYFFEFYCFLNFLKNGMNILKVSNIKRLRCRNEYSKRFPTPKVKSPQEEEKKEMKYSLAFHAEGKNAELSYFKLTLAIR